MLNAEENELKELKSLVNQFLDSIYEVPFRAEDCNQQLVENLWKRLADAVNDANSDVKRTLQ
jgi:hypothetical protein